MATPVLMATLAAPFFAYVTFGDIKGSRRSLMIALTIGTIQNILSKATKYAFFDPTKEMAYIPLDQEAKVSHRRERQTSNVTTRLFCVYAAAAAAAAADDDDVV